MATFRRRGKRWLAEIKLAGVRECATRATKAEAASWAREREADILAHRQGRAHVWVTPPIALSIAVRHWSSVHIP